MPCVEPGGDRSTVARVSLAVSVYAPYALWIAPRSNRNVLGHETVN